MDKGAYDKGHQRQPSEKRVQFLDFAMLTFQKLKVVCARSLHITRLLFNGGGG